MNDQVTIVRTNDETIVSAIHWCAENKSSHVKVACCKRSKLTKRLVMCDITIWKKSSANYIIRNLTSTKFVTFIFSSSDDACLFALRVGRVDPEMDKSVSV